jgi:tricorn protease
MNSTNRFVALVCSLAFSLPAIAEGTRLLRQPTISETQIAFVYGGDIWVSELDQQQAVRITSTAAVESEPHFSPDGKTIAFSSDRSGTASVYVVSVDGGPPKRLTWHPAPALVRGWTPDGNHVLYASRRETAPTRINRLWTVPIDGGAPTMMSAQWGNNGSFSATGNQIVLDRISRWDVEWRAYRGGQNTPLVILDLDDASETFLPNSSTTDVEPLWIGDTIYFLSDRDWTSNVWAYSPASGTLKQITEFQDNDIKQLAGNAQLLAFERDGYLHTLDPDSGESSRLDITVSGDFPWAETQWQDVSQHIQSVSLSPTGKRVIMAARGEIFTVPVEHGDTRNITRSSGAADRSPLWSPEGDKIAWFSDAGGNGDSKSYGLFVGDQDGLSSLERYSIGESKMAWEPVWSPDGQLIAFVDDDVRIRVVDLQSRKIITVDVGGSNLERGRNGLTWSSDSNWLAYSKAGGNGFRRIYTWSRQDKEANALTNSLADAFSPAWDRGGKHLYFLASTDVALGTGWANTSAMTSRPVYGAYVVNLTAQADSPFKPRSDEEAGEKAPVEEEDESGEKVSEPVVIEFDGIERRTMAMPMPKGNYKVIVSGPAGTAFIGEQTHNDETMVLQKFSLEEGEAEPFAENVASVLESIIEARNTQGNRSVSVSADGNKLLVNIGDEWQVLDAENSDNRDSNGGAVLEVSLKMNLDRSAEWKQMFEDAWRYQRDYFYDPNMHGRDWKEVYDRYAPLVPYIKHRSAMTYVIDQTNGELSVGHSFVFGGDYPDVNHSTTGLLGADLLVAENRWKIGRIYTSESWNPELTGPLDQPGLNIETGHYLVGVNGRELHASDSPYAFLDGTAGQQTVLHINDKPKFKGAWQETVKPIASESALRQRTWVEDNRRLVDKLSDGKLGYIWIPNTGGPGFESFNRYFFGQQDKQGAVIDERFNGGGSLDDYMVDLMTRSIRASSTNEVPHATPIRLPAGILGPKVLLINEMAGSGGDFFPWVFRQQQAGPLIGSRTWGGLVKSSVHYALVDGGALTAPDNAIFDPVNNKWVAENEGVAPDIEVYQDAKSLGQGEDPQLKRAVAETLRLLDEQGELSVLPPPYSTPAIQ